MDTMRNPYVGAGEDGARRSAQIDREEWDGLAWDDPRRDELMASAQRWEDQAHRLMLERVGPRPSLEQVRADVGNEEWLAALALVDLSPTLRASVAGYAEWTRESGTYDVVDDDEGLPGRGGILTPNPVINWDAWVADVDQGRGWSSTEWRLFDLVAALVVDERTVKLRGVLDGLGSWETDALRILVEWASGGNNRENPGRVTAQAR